MIRHRFGSVRLFLFIVNVLGTGGCAAPIRYFPLAVDPAWELLYVVGGGSIRLDPGGTVESRCIYRSGAQVVFPRCSPDRTQVAFYQFSDRRGALRVAKIAGEATDGSKKWAESVVEIEGPAGDRMAVFAPVWDADGQGLLLIDPGGINRIHLNRSHERIVHKEDIVALSVGPLGKQLAYADGERIIVADMEGREIASFTTATPAIPGRQAVQPIAFSPDGKRIAYAAGRSLFTLDLTSMKTRELCDVEDPIYWLQWLPGQERLVFTSGLSLTHLREGASTTPYRVDHGQCTLFSVGANGRGLRPLFKDGGMDVQLAQPTLSEDGAYVALVSGREDMPRVVIAATDAPGVVTLTSTETSSQPSWVYAPMPSIAGSASRPCPVIVVYPLR